MEVAVIFTLDSRRALRVAAGAWIFFSKSGLMDASCFKWLICWQDGVACWHHAGIPAGRFPRIKAHEDV